jgi:hypothetical protein
VFYEPSEEHSISIEAQGLYYGKNCPVGQVQVEMVNPGSGLRHSKYGWTPGSHAIIELYVDGRRFCIRAGDFGDYIPGSVRRGLTVTSDSLLTSDNWAANSTTIWIDDDKFKKPTDLTLAV